MIPNLDFLSRNKAFEAKDRDNFKCNFYSLSWLLSLKLPLNQCCGSGMIYSGSSFEFPEFWIRIQAKVPDP